jgi:hypothetical protein
MGRSYWRRFARARSVGGSLRIRRAFNFGFSPGKDYAAKSRPALFTGD